MAEPSIAKAQPELIYMKEEMPQMVKQQKDEHMVCGGLNQQTDFTKAQTYAD
jgi:hypothetical protein